MKNTSITDSMNYVWRRGIKEIADSVGIEEPEKMEVGKLKKELQQANFARLHNVHGIGNVITKNIICWVWDIPYRSTAQSEMSEIPTPVLEEKNKLGKAEMILIFQLCVIWLTVIIGIITKR